MKTKLLKWVAFTILCASVSPVRADGEVDAPMSKVVMYAQDGAILSVESNGALLLRVSLTVEGKEIEVPKAWLKANFAPRISRTRLLDCMDTRLPQYKSCYAVEIEGRFAASPESASDYLYFDFRNGSFVGLEEVRE